ncbi:hypothetical protein [Streptomyces poonensis]|uniref:DUF4232 domain-containing protein n=1 Tax=Streptomyces poonensis TaxID=68255 RepID=A0A918PLC4_9ACTN|nr:hypothetical protein [Streptomyces poonensis]GGZ14493.1 hypothetical protein GCM10010365_38050 [Streptomyces poonensis]GLJ93299.1 hypothetical protein GCM10017589_59110 [Streptomyces poonensis]
MGSLRNPVGPLPSSIYWRRRAVLLSVVALLALLAAWVLTRGGGDTGSNANGSNGKNPLPSITAGPSGSGPAISEAPGGRDESGGGGSSGSGDGSDEGADEGADGGSASGSDGGSGDGSGDSAGSGSASGSGGGGAGSGGEVGGGTGQRLPAGSGLPDCTTGDVELTLRSVRNTYEPGDKPTFELIAKNTSGNDCKVDLGPKKAVLTITQADADDDLWSSVDCPEGAGSVLFRVPAESGITRTIEWDRKPSEPNCATPSARSAPAGTYLVEIKAPGLGNDRTSFVLEKD